MNNQFNYFRKKKIINKLKNNKNKKKLINKLKNNKKKN